MESTTNKSNDALFNRLLQLKADTDLEFIKEFLESAPKQLQVDFTLLSQSIREGNSANRVFHAHKLKGLLLTIGADAAAALSMKLEGFAGGNDDTELQSLLSELEAELKELLVTLYCIAPKLIDP